MADLRELFARVKAQSAEQQERSESDGTQQHSIWNPMSSSAYQQPSVSSPIVSPPILTPNPTHSTSILSPVHPSSGAGTPASDQSRSNNLLNLLKFNSQSAQPALGSPMGNLQNIATRQAPASAAAPFVHNPSAPSNQDYIGNLHKSIFSNPASALTDRPALPAQPSRSAKEQDFLLNLLKKPTAMAMSQAPPAAPTPPPREFDPLERLSFSLAQSSGQPEQSSSAILSREPTPEHQLESTDLGGPSYAAPQSTKISRFAYVNPFDQLHASSPLTRPAESNGVLDNNKDDVLIHNPEPSVAEKIADDTQSALKSRKLGTPDMILAAPSPQAGRMSLTVAEALEGVGERADKEVQQALAAAPALIQPLPTLKPSSKKEIVTNEDVDSSWESAEDSPNEKPEQHIKVYNFPMRPFVSIQIREPSEPVAPFRQDNFTKVAILKKDFDQLDRCLATASQSYIVYAQPTSKTNNKGIRIIHQDTGDHIAVFKGQERVFNVQICSPPGATEAPEAVLGTGVDGSVFWTSVPKSRGDLLVDADIEANGFILPPVPTAEETASGSPVKTRAKLSTRHPEYFALARGKQIHIVGPRIALGRDYCSPTNHKVNSEKYLAEHSLKINTGKAGKDFCFSEDDTTISSLDKSGRIKFWDIRDLTRRASDSSRRVEDPVELAEPLWQLVAMASGSKPDEKPSVSSIMLLDKERPHLKGIALRYMLIGFKQNHILQLWDLGLGKAVQEIRLPHDKDSDGICSVNYHAKSGIIAIGHPTRNSVYFVHLSAPKYSLPSMDQARYIGMLARNDPTLPKPDSTSIMSGLRELSLANVGHLRSVDMLRVPVESAAEKDSEDETLFELYVLHSTALVAISIKKLDLGWNKESRMIEPVDAVEAGMITVTDLQVPPAKEITSEIGAAVETPSKKPVEKKESKRHEPTKTPAKIEIAKKEMPITLPTAEPMHKHAPISLPSPQPATTTAAPITTEPYNLAAQRAISPEKQSTASTSATTVLAEPPAPAMPAGTIKPVGDNSTLSRHFDSLYTRLDADKRVSEAAGAAKQDAILRLVSSTLTENVEQTLGRIINASIEKEVLPALSDTTGKIVDRKVTELLPRHVGNSVQRELSSALPHALQQALKDTQIQRAISDAVANQVTSKVQEQVTTLLQQSLPQAASQAAQRMLDDVEKGFGQQLRDAELRREQDAIKIDQLTGMVQNLEKLVQSMADRQGKDQEDIPKGRPPISQETNLGATEPQLSPMDREVTRITQMLVNHEYEAATIEWLQSTYQKDLFDDLFVRVNPQYLQQVSSLVSLSVGNVITLSFAQHVEQRLEWLGVVLSQINIDDQDIIEVAPGIMDLLSQRLQGAYMVISENQPGSPLLRRISALNRQVTDIKRMVS